MCYSSFFLIRVSIICNYFAKVQHLFCGYKFFNQKFRILTFQFL